MLAHLWPCENMPVFLQKSVGGLFMGRGSSWFVSPPCCRRSQHQFSPLSVTWLVPATELCRLKKQQSIYWKLLRNGAQKWLYQFMEDANVECLKPSLLLVWALKTCGVVTARTC